MGGIPQTLEEAIQARTALFLSMIAWIVVLVGALTLVVDTAEGGNTTTVLLRLIEFGGVYGLLRACKGPRWRLWLVAMFCWWGMAESYCNALLLPPETAATSSMLVPIGAGFFPVAFRTSVRQQLGVVLATMLGLVAGGILAPSVLVLPLTGGVIGLVFSQMQYRAEVQAWQLREAALAASEARERFLARVSHEMRTPLNGVMGMLGAIGAEPLSADQRAALNAAEQSSRLLRTTIDDVLSFSAGESGGITLSPRPVDVVALLQQLISTILPPTTAVTVRLEASPLPARLDVDPDRLQQIVHHLVENGIRFTEAGEVVVRLRWADQLLIEVTDTGPGLPMPLPELLGAFVQGDETTTRPHGGAGLGLTLTHQLVTAMGGQLRATDRPAGGAHFLITLPLPVSAPDALAPPARPRPQISGRVLIVDDNAINRRVLRRMLEAAGATVDEAADGVDGLNKMTAQVYHLVFMDHHMPVMDGLEATRQARAAGIRCPIVAVTASAQPSARDESAQAGMDHHLNKPITAEALDRVIHAVFDTQATRQKRTV